MIACPRYPQASGIGPGVKVISSERHLTVQNSRETLGGSGRVYPPRLFFCELWIRSKQASPAQGRRSVQSIAAMVTSSA
jgi:hypothetical protein